MCHIFAGQDPHNYQYVTRSVRLGGYSTSVKLERKFWEILDLIADEQSLSTPKFLCRIYDEAIEINGVVKNFASLLRCACALYLAEPNDVMETVRAELAKG